MVQTTQYTNFSLTGEQEAEEVAITSTQWHKACSAKWRFAQEIKEYPGIHYNTISVGIKVCESIERPAIHVRVDDKQSFREQLQEFHPALIPYLYEGCLYEDVDVELIEEHVSITRSSTLSSW